jgi:hypothetical protein
MTELPNIVRERLKTQAVSDHPDADVLTAFSEQLLPAPERAQVMTHLATCVDCREVLALALPQVEVQSRVAPAPAHVSWLSAPLVRWASLAACLVVVGAAVLLREHKPVTMHSDGEVGLHGTQTTSPQEEKATKADALRDKSEEGSLQAVSKAKPGAVPAAPPASAELTHQALAPATPAAGAMAKKSSSADADQFAMNRQDEAEARRVSPQVPAASAGAAFGARTENSGGAQTHLTLPAPQPAPPAASAAGMVSETVEVSASAPQIETQSAKLAAAPGRAKAAPAQNALDQAAGVSANKDLLAKQETAPVSAAGARWTLSDQGQLQRSVDSGKSWEAVPVVQSVTFRALSAIGLEIWVGGMRGVLYHSADGGTHWTQVKPTADGVQPTGDIATLRFTDVQHGQLTTSTGETWTTSDAGQSWHKN